MNESDLTKTVVDPAIQARMLSELRRQVEQESSHADASAPEMCRLGSRPMTELERQPLGETLSLPLEVLLARLREFGAVPDSSASAAPALDASATDASATHPNSPEEKRSRAIVRRNIWRAWGSQLRSSLELLHTYWRTEPWLKRGTVVLASVLTVHLAVLARSTRGQTAQGSPSSAPAQTGTSALDSSANGAQSPAAPVPAVVTARASDPEASTEPPVPGVAKARSLQRAAIDAAAEGRYAAALELYQELVRRYPTVPAYSEALRILEARVELQP